MATGTGKTWVIAMIILWQALRTKRRTDIVIITPNLTVTDRLSELDPSASWIRGAGSPDGPVLYGTLLPPGMSMPRNLHVSIVNFQAFRRRQELAVDGPKDVPSGVIKRVLNPHNHESTDRWTETDDKMLHRVLSSHRGAEEIIVINDEAHHCRRPLDTPSTGNDEDDEQDAALWFGILSALERQGRLSRIYDLSATPMYLQQPAGLDTVLFPWIVSDYSLIDAIEAGLVKIPTVPTDDDTRRDGHDMLPVYRNVYANLQSRDRNLRHGQLPETVEQLLESIHKDYGTVADAYSESGITPVMIVVANTVKNANELYKHIAGYSETDDKKHKIWHKGHYGHFSNVRPDESGPVDQPPTLLVHSKLDESDWGKMYMQNEFFAPKPDAKKAEQVQHIRRAFNTVGQAGEPGEHIRCIISVSMLSEGWDVRTVTHIFGFRQFGSQLLCEQVAGRALRRTSIQPGKDGRLEPEYAQIFGVPFSFMREGKNKPRPPPARWKVHTVRGRNGYRIQFPNLLSYSVILSSARLRLDPDKVEPYEAIYANTPTFTTMEGPVGQTTQITTDLRRNRVIYGIAKHASDKLRLPDGRGDRMLFASMVNAVRDWLRHPKVKCENVGLLAHDPHREAIPEMLVRTCVQDPGSASIMPVFMDEYDPTQRRVLDTSDVSFETSLKHRYPRRGSTKHSELNAAACHTKPEAVLATLLDSNRFVAAWARNFRLGCSIPYMDNATGRWRRYEPDFVAQISNSGKPASLIIEFKGVVDDAALVKQQETRRMWLSAVNNSDDPACEGYWGYTMLDRDDRISMERDLDRAVNSLLAEVARL